jgi:hypothetical protein
VCHFELLNKLIVEEYIGVPFNVLSKVIGGEYIGVPLYVAEQTYW